jgi:hypothetical protein
MRGSGGPCLAPSGAQAQSKLQPWTKTQNDDPPRSNRERRNRRLQQSRRAGFRTLFGAGAPAAHKMSSRLRRSPRTSVGSSSSSLGRHHWWQRVWRERHLGGCVRKVSRRFQRASGIKDPFTPTSGRASPHERFCNMVIPGSSQTKARESALQEHMRPSSCGLAAMESNDGMLRGIGRIVEADIDLCGERDRIGRARRGWFSCRAAQSGLSAQRGNH